MAINQLIIITLLTTLVSGCLSSTLQEKSSVPFKRPALSDSFSIIYIYKSDQFPSSEHDRSVIINETNISRLAHGEFTWVYAMPGKIKISSFRDGSGRPMSLLQIDTLAAKEYVVNLDVYATQMSMSNSLRIGYDGTPYPSLDTDYGFKDELILVNEKKGLSILEKYTYQEPLVDQNVAY